MCGGTKFTSPVDAGFETTDRAWIVKPRSDNVVLDASWLSESNNWGRKWLCTSSRNCGELLGVSAGSMATPTLWDGMW